MAHQSATLIIRSALSPTSAYPRAMAQSFSRVRPSPAKQRIERRIGPARAGDVQSVCRDLKADEHV